MDSQVLPERVGGGRREFTLRYGKRGCDYKRGVPLCRYSELVTLPTSENLRPVSLPAMRDPGSYKCYRVSSFIYQIPTPPISLSLRILPEE
jgi:hypothetical protein